MKRYCLIAVGFCLAMHSANAQNLDSKLKKAKPGSLVKRVLQRGNAKRGALIFYKSAAACSKCHDDSGKTSPLGPKLASIAQHTKDMKDEQLIQHIVDSVLYPSNEIREEYQTVMLLTVGGNVVSGLVAEKNDDRFVLRDAADLQKEIIVKQNNIEAVKKSKTSMMPEGLASSLGGEDEFFDLAKYVFEVARGGQERADKLRPSAEQLIVKDDTKNLNHAGILSKLSARDFENGRQIYQGHCVNCHGADGNKPSLATARAFGTQKLKFGADPLSMLATLTRGNGLMAPMQHLSPRERYQVIHYIRESFMKDSNADYVAINRAYLKSLPKGTDSGDFAIARDRDYGPVLGSQLGGSINNSLTFRLPGGVTVNYDLHRFRLGGAWTDGFLDLSQTQHYRQRGERMPQPAGMPLAGLDQYGWIFGDSFELSADAKPPRGPVHDEHAKYFGHYLHNRQAVISYRIGDRKILETIDADSASEHPVIRHTMKVMPGNEVKLAVAKKHSGGKNGFVRIGEANVQSVSGGAVSDYTVVAASPDVKAYENSQSKNQARYVVPADKAKGLDLGTINRSIVVRFKTRRGGTLIASAPKQGEWKPDGKTLFVRGKRLVFDIGWVGALSGKTTVTDNKWHTAVLHVDDEQTRLYVDGKKEAARDEFRRDPVAGHVLKIGATATDFGGDFDGQIAWASILKGEQSEAELLQLSQSAKSPEEPIWSWKDGDESPPAAQETEVAEAMFAMVGVAGDANGLKWSVSSEDRFVLTIPASNETRVIQVVRSSQPLSALSDFQKTATGAEELTDPESMTRGGEIRWPQILETTGNLGESDNGYALDTISVPFTNPWNAWMRTSALDFFADGRCVVTTHGGDVYIVSGIDDKLESVRWKRFCAGLFEPFGVRVVDEQIYVTCRDGIKRLHDYDGNGEADFVEAFWIDEDVSCMFHAYNFDLQTDSKGNFYFAKAGQYTHHHRPGTIMRVPPEGGRADVVAWGIRTPNGMGKLSDDRFTVSDNQGPWMPAGKISLIKPDAFLGNMPINEEQDQWLRAKHGGELPETFDEPFIWMPQEVDNSCGGQVWVDDDRWGPLADRLIHSSFGKGWLYYLSLQEVGDTMQSSIINLPHQWDAGVMRLRVNPADGQVYGVGLSGWQGPKGGKDGCLQRLRYTGEPVKMIEQVRVKEQAIELTFNFAVGKRVHLRDAWVGQMWDYLWSKKYGSDQFSVLREGQKGRDDLQISGATVSDDGKTVTLKVLDLQVCDQIRLDIDIDDENGERYLETVHMTVHKVP